MAERAPSYKRINDQQREILERYYHEREMNSKAARCNSAIEDAAKEANLSVDQVKKWIGNFTAKRKKELNSNTVVPEEPQLAKKVKLPSYIKPPSGYNLFCAEIFKSEPSGSSLTSRNKLAAEKWSNLQVHEKEAYNTKANECSNFVNPEILNDDEKTSLIDKHIKQISKDISRALIPALLLAYTTNIFEFVNVQFLEKMGCEFSGILLSPSGEVCHLASAEGQNFLNIHSDVDLKFREHFACPKVKIFTEKDVTSLFQKKYSDLVGHPCGVVPWKRGNFDAVGMPDGIALKKPCFYGSKQIQGIMKNENLIKFVFKEASEGGDEPYSDTNKEDDDNGDEINNVNLYNSTQDLSELLPVLATIVDETAASRVINGGDLIDETEVEVIDLTLPQNLRFQLHMCESLFTDDAALAVASNLQQSDEVCDLVLAMYSPTKGQFWLFHCHNSPHNINALVKKKSRARLWGHWFDHNPSTDDYIIQKQQDCVQVKSLVCSKVGGFVFDIVPSSIQNYKLPKSMKDAVLSIFTYHGFI